MERRGRREFIRRVLTGGGIFFFPLYNCFAWSSPVTAFQSASNKILTPHRGGFCSAPADYLSSGIKEAMFYRDISSARLGPVLKTLKVISEENKLLEIVCLIVPTLNDDPSEIRMMCKWISDNLGSEVPIHFTRFSPSYRLTNLPPTPVRTLETAVTIAFEEGLKFVYIGNVPGHKYNSTFCPGCNNQLIHRLHFSVMQNNIENGSCRFCGLEIPGIWEM